MQQLARQFQNKAGRNSQLIYFHHLNQTRQSGSISGKKQICKVFRRLPRGMRGALPDCV